MANVSELISQARQGFSQVKVGDSYKEAALQFIEQWLTDPQYADYTTQIEHLITAGHWDYLLDCFYQVIPFGTGGRRGEVGVGPNRINQATIRSSAQGHSQYLLKAFGEESKNRGVVLAYDVRHFYGNKFLNAQIANPVQDLDGLALAQAAAEVYAANGLKVYLFDGARTTPELSFAVRHLQALGGDVFSASHNPPEHNGKKVYDETGGQLIPPFDEDLVKEVTENVKEIKSIAFNEALEQDQIIMIGQEIDEAYWQAVLALSLSKERAIKLAYTPLHGCGGGSIGKILPAAGFNLQSDPKTSNPSGKFENIVFNNPNPEVEQSYTNSLPFAEEVQADLLLNSDPDADRLGVMVKHQNTWQFLNGNQIAVLLTDYVVRKQGSSLSVVVKTEVTTDLVARVAKGAGVQVIGDLLVGFKFIGVEMNKLEKEGRINDFLFGAEESHGYIAGNYVRDKDAAVAALRLCELAAELKTEGKTLLDRLAEIESQYGLVRNSLNEIRLPGAEGMSQIKQITQTLNDSPPSNIGRFRVTKVDKWLDRLPIVSETDRAAKQGIVFHLAGDGIANHLKVTVRPSGTEPKSKMYFEIGTAPFTPANREAVVSEVEALRTELEQEFMKACYRAIGIEFPDRGFLLFWQLPVKDKMYYFEIEPQLAALKDLPDEATRIAKAKELLAFLGADPVMKVDKAFAAEYGQGVLAYLGIGGL